MKKTDKLLILFLMLLVSCASIVFADGNSDGVISRPVIEYSSGDLRDPFGDLLQLAAEKEKKEKAEQNIQTPQETIEPEKPMPTLDKIKVQGLIWGGRFPQVVINNKILGIGDSIEGFEIVSIDKKGIALSFSGRVVNLAIPGNAPASVKGNKEDK